MKLAWIEGIKLSSCVQQINTLSLNSYSDISGGSLLTKSSWEHDFVHLSAASTVLLQVRKEETH